MVVATTMPNGGKQHLLIARVTRHQKGICCSEVDAQTHIVFLTKTLDGLCIHFQLPFDGVAAESRFIQIGLQKGIHLIANKVFTIPILVVFPLFSLPLLVFIECEINGLNRLVVNGFPLIGIVNVLQQNPK